MLSHDGGLLRVLGGPGTGKTTLAADVVADRILRRGVHPENVLVLTANRSAAIALRARDQPADQCVRADARACAPRTGRWCGRVHSYAFGVLRLQAALDDLPPPRLLSGPEQDVVVRELLAGDLADDGARGLAGADAAGPGTARFRRRTAGPAAARRRTRCRAGGPGRPRSSARAGRNGSRPASSACGTRRSRAARRAVHPPLDAAELVNSRAGRLRRRTTTLREREQARVRHLLVDDSQQLDPQQFQLIVRTRPDRGRVPAVRRSGPGGVLLPGRGRRAARRSRPRQRPDRRAAHRPPHGARAVRRPCTG